jgi:hypothetical protein
MMFRTGVIFHEYVRAKIFDHVDTLKAISIVLILLVWLPGLNVFAKM